MEDKPGFELTGEVTDCSGRVVEIVVVVGEFGSPMLWLTMSLTWPDAGFLPRL